ncbi:MAG: serine hydrolase domain-containing protein [Chthoniobacterales bacterium]
MKPRPRYYYAALLGVLCAAGSGPLRADHVDDVVAAQIRQHHIPGLALAIIEGGAVAREQGYGYADTSQRTAVTPSTLFQAGSVSKAVSALGALHLVDQGKASLDEDINSKLRTWQIPQNGFTKEHAVTLRLILSHSAGLTVHGFSGYPVDAPLPSLVQILNGQRPANSAAVRVEEVPGSHWNYSGGGYLVIQQMIMDLTGKPFGQYMHETVLQPLGMVSSSYAQPLPAAMADHAATGYAGLFRRAIKGRWRVHPELAAAGLWTTPGDLARFLIGIQRSRAGTSNPIISRSTTRQMLTNQKNDDGLGVFIGGEPLKFGHDGSNVGFDTMTIAFADRGQGAVIMMNTNVDIKALKEILLDAIGEQYRWPGYPVGSRRTPNHAMQPTPGRRTTQFSMTLTSHPAATRAHASGG